MCMEAFGAQNGLEFNDLLEKCVLACLTRTKHDKTSNSPPKRESLLEEAVSTSTDLNNT